MEIFPYCPPSDCAGQKKMALLRAHDTRMKNLVIVERGEQVPGQLLLTHELVKRVVPVGVVDGIIAVAPGVEIAMLDIVPVESA